MGFHINMVGHVMVMEPHICKGWRLLKATPRSRPVECFDRIETTTTFGRPLRLLMVILQSYVGGLMLFAAVDRARSIPLFYGSASGGPYQ